MTAPAASGAVRASASMVVAVGLFAAMNALVKQVGASYSVSQIIFSRTRRRPLCKKRKLEGHATEVC